MMRPLALTAPVSPPGELQQMLLVSRDTAPSAAPRPSVTTSQPEGCLMVSQKNSPQHMPLIQNRSELRL